MTGRALRAARLLLDVRAGGAPLAALPEDLRPATADDAYAIQDAVLAALGPVAAWKVGAKAPDAPPAWAGLPAAALHVAPTVLPGAGLRVRAVEAELAFRFARDLPARAEDYGRDEVLDAVGAVLPAIEVLDSRYADWQAVDRLQQLADSLNNGALIVGPPVVGWRKVDPRRQRVRLLVDGAEVADAVDGNPAGDPLLLLPALANALSRRGQGLAAGTIVTTGSCTGIVAVAVDATVTAEFPGLGTVGLRFAPPA